MAFGIRKNSRFIFSDLLLGGLFRTDAAIVSRRRRGLRHGGRQALTGEE